MTTNTSHRPLIVGDTITLKSLDALDPVEVKGSELQAGMAILDEFHCPVLVLDHKVRATRRSGSVEFMAWKLEGRFADGSNFGRVDFHRNRTVTVAAA